MYHLAEPHALPHQISAFIYIILIDMMDQNVLSSDHMAFGPRDLVWFDLMNVSSTFGGHVCSYAHDKF